MFNPRPQLNYLAIDAAASQRCIVIDDALLDPQAWTRVAQQQWSSFAEHGHNAYPGVELELPEGITARIDDYFAQHLRRPLGARRIVRSHSRLALITEAPCALQPRQWICHRDRLSADPRHLIAASVLYLFDDPQLGGTSFYRPRQSEPQTARLVHDSGHLSASEFSQRYGIAAGYMVDSNDWFERTLTVEARYNRMLVYPGDIYHCADLRHPQLLRPDPAMGRLTWNGFFTCTRLAN